MSIDFLELINKVGREVKKHSDEYRVLPDLDAKFKDYGYDSLDHLMLMVYIGEIYGIPEEIGKKFYPETVKELKIGVEKFKTKEPSSIEEALQSI